MLSKTTFDLPSLFEPEQPARNASEHGVDRSGSDERAVAQALRQLPAASIRSIAPLAHRRLDPLVEDALLRPMASHPESSASRRFDEVFQAWQSTMLARRKDGGESVRRSVVKDVYPALAHRMVTDIQRDDVVPMLDAIVARGAARQAGCVLADLRQMFRWAIEQGMMSSDPTATLRKSDFGGAPQARRRRLTQDEVLELAVKMHHARLSRHVRQSVWLMLATGARIGEIAQARWQDIDAAGRTWTIPEEFSHSRRAHVVPLSAFALRHLLPETRSARLSPWVFSSRAESEPLSPKALGKQLRDRQRGTQIRGRASATTSLLLAGGAWTPLDLRRTVAGMMAELGTRADTIGLCLNQGRTRLATTPSGSAQQLEACRAAFERLGERLALIEHTASDPPSSAR